jgi:hypothetical protein
MNPSIPPALRCVDPEGVLPLVEPQNLQPGLARINFLCLRLAWVFLARARAYFATRILIRPAAVSPPTGFLKDWYA